MAPNVPFSLTLSPSDGAREKNFGTWTPNSRFLGPSEPMNHFAGRAALLRRLVIVKGVILMQAAQQRRPTFRFMGARERSAS